MIAMKNLIYKELKLAWHPIIYVFILLFPFMCLIPTYPTWIGYIYVCSSYPILFLGANKGQQSNDIVYTALLPVRKKDIVRARIYSLIIMLAVTMILIGVLTPVAIYLRDELINDTALEFMQGTSPLSLEDALAKATDQFVYGLPHEAYFATSGFALLAFAFFDYFFLTWFYKNGRSILLPTLLGMLGFILILSIFAIVFPFIIPGYIEFFSTLYIQIITFIICLLVFIGVLFAAYHVSVKNLEKVNL